MANTQDNLPTNIEDSELSRLLDELEDATWCSRGSSHTQNLAVIERGQEARKSIMALIKSDREAAIVNRFEVTNHLSDGSGREVRVWNGEPFKVETSLQDQGQTLKVVLTDVAQLSKENKQ